MGSVRAFEIAVEAGSEITGSGTAGTLPVFTAATVIGNSIVTQGTAGNALTFTPNASTSGTITPFTYTAPANTGQSTGVEATGMLFSMGSRQWAGSTTIALQREIRFTPATYTAVSATTITDAFGVVFNPPTASTNVTITNNWAAGFNGNVKITGSTTITTLTSGSVVFAGTGGLLSQNNNNFYWNIASGLLNVGTSGDQTGTDPINIYNQYDTYQTNANNTAGTATSAGVSASSSRGTGQVPLQSNDTDFIGGFNGWGYNGTAYVMLTDIRTYVSGVTSTNRGGQLEFYTKQDGGSGAGTLNRVGYFTQNGATFFTPTIATSGAITSFTITNPANTNQTTATEIQGFKYTGGSRQWATGSFSSQRETYFSATTYTAVGASTITNAYGFYVDAPIASTNITITKNWAAGFNGNVSVSGNLDVSGNITSATWTGSVITPQYGGTGIANNVASTLTISGSFASTFTVTGAFNYTFPTATATLLANNLGLSGGTTLIGGTAVGDAVTLQGTSANATTTANAFIFKGGNAGASTLFTITNNGSWAISNVASSSGAVIDFNFTGAADTNQTLSVEINRVLWTSSTRQWATGAITTQREFLITAPTYSFVGTSTITDAYTFYSTAPIAGTNATITNTWCAGGNGSVKFTGTANLFGNAAVNPTALGSFRIGQGTSIIDIGELSAGRAGIWLDQSSPSTSNYTFWDHSGDLYAQCQLGGTLFLGAGGAQYFSLTRTQANFISGTANGGAVITYLFTQPSNTQQTTTAEVPGFKYLGGSRQWATGSIATQRESYLSTSTYTAVGASTITNAYGFYVEAPTASTNITITNNWSIGASGNFAVSGSSFFGSLTTAPTGLVTIGAGTTTVAPITLTSGTNKTTPASGDTEYNGTSLFFTNSGAQRQELIQSQQGRVSADFNKTTDTTLANVTGLTATLVAGKTYTFYAKLFITGDAVGGTKYTIASDGTLSATDVKFQINSINNATNLFIINSRVTALGTTQSEAVASATSAWTEISGTITVNVGGVISVQFAQSVSNGTSSVLRGSYFVVNQVA